MNDGMGELMGQILLAGLVGIVILGVVAGFLVGRRKGCLPGFLVFLGVTGGLMGWAYVKMQVEPEADRERWKLPELTIVLPPGYTGPAWVLFDGHHPPAPQRAGVTRLEIPAKGVAAFADPGPAIEHCHITLVDPQGKPFQTQLLPSGNYVSEKGLVRYLGVFVGTTYECQQYNAAHNEPWKDAYQKL